MSENASVDPEGVADENPFEMPQYSELGYRRLLIQLQRSRLKFLADAKSFRDVGAVWANGKAKDSEYSARVIKSILRKHKKAMRYFKVDEENDQSLARRVSDSE